MADTPSETSAFRHYPAALQAVGIAAIAAGFILRCLAAQGELWLDELWSLIHVIDLNTPVAIFTSVKHDNNHLLNSVWMWLMGLREPALAHRLPSLFFSVVLLIALARHLLAHQRDGTMATWIVLVAASYPVILYSTEARGYSLALLMSVIGYLSLVRLLERPSDSKAMLAFSISGIIGCLSHAIYVLFLAPAIVWIGYCAITSAAELNVRKLVRTAILPPVLTACILTLTFYAGMEIGGAPLLPYLEVAASTISVSFGGEPLSASSPAVTGWSAFLALFVIVVCISELAMWVRSKDPQAVLVSLILITPWIAVPLLQPHFILPRYFLIQVVFAYLVVARFTCRLASRGTLGRGIGIALIIAIVAANVRHTYQLWSLGRSHFREVFSSAASSVRKGDDKVSIGGDQDFQNSLRLHYAIRSLPQNQGKFDNLQYIPSYRTSQESPRFVIRETLDAHEELPTSFTLPSGAKYSLLRVYKAPPLSSSHVYVYEKAE
jgi:hypothetical protein